MSFDPTGSSLLDTWTETSARMFEGVVAANRAAIAAFGVPTGGGVSGVSAGAGTDTDEADGPEIQPTGDPTERIEPDEDLPEWHAETAIDDVEDIGVGDHFEFTKTVAEEDVTRFAAASGDTNPLHLDAEFAEDTRFRGRIAHGALVGGLISAALARVPGVIVYLSQDMEFHNPVRLGDRVTAECEVVEDLGNDQFRLSTRVFDGDDVAIDGEAVIMIDDV